MSTVDPNTFLAPLQTPPEPAERPPLPSAPRAPAFSPDVREQYELSTHIFAAAFPRTYPAVDLPAFPAADADRATRKEGVACMTEELVLLRLKYSAGELDGEPRDGRLLWMCANRYRRRREGLKGLTLVLCHSISVTKESWEPVIDQLISQSLTSSLVIEEIWCLESVQHGDSALVNEGRISALFDWRDQGRDLLHFLLHYLPESSSSPLPTHIPRLCDATAQRRTLNGWENRTLVGVGHSLGGLGMMFAAITQPKLFNSFISIEATVGPLASYGHTRARLPRIILATLSRRSVWPSLAAARADLAKLPLLQHFDPAQLALYVESALQVLPDGRARLKQDPRVEAVVFEHSGLGPAWELGPCLGRETRLLWIRASRLSIVNASAKDSDEFIRRISAARGGKDCQKATVPGGHLIVQENPKGVAEEMHKYLNAQYGTTSARL